MKFLKFILPFLFIASMAYGQTTPWSTSPAITGQTRTLSGSPQIRWLFGTNLFSLPDSLNLKLNFKDTTNLIATHSYVSGHGGSVTPSSQTVFTNKKLVSSTDTIGAVSMSIGGDAKGDIYYRDASGHLLNLPIGSNFQYLTSFLGVPVWSSPVTISATSPIFYSGGVISSQAASASQNGYLISTDWSLFNGKQNALTFDTTPTSGSTNPVTSGGLYNWSVPYTGAINDVNLGLSHNLFAGNSVVKYNIGASGVYAQQVSTGDLLQIDPLVLNFYNNVSGHNTSLGYIDTITSDVNVKLPARSGIIDLIPTTQGLPTDSIKVTRLGKSYMVAQSSVGTVTNVSSANGDISVATGTTTPVLTLNSGTGANQIVKRDGSGNLNATTVTTNANLTGEVTSIGNAATINKAITPTWTNQHTFKTSGNNQILLQSTSSSSVAGINFNNSSGVGKGGIGYANPSFPTGSIAGQVYLAADTVNMGFSVDGGFHNALTLNTSGNAIFSGNLSAVLPAYSSGTNLSVVYNSTNNRFETTTGGGGGSGTVTSVSSANSDISVATGTTTPVLTLNSGSGANQIVKRDGSGNLNATTVTTNANLTGAITSIGNATILGSFSSANLSGALTDETGTGSSVFAGSPALTGTPTAPTATVGTNTTQIATTAFVLANAGTGITYQSNATSTGLSKSTLNSTYSTAQHGWVVYCPNANIKYLKMDDSSTGNWDSSPYNPVP